MKNFEDLEAVFFDFDGVLIDTFELSLEVCRLFDPDLTVKDFKEHHNYNREKASKIDIGESDERFFKEKGQRLATDQLFPIEDTVKELSKEHELFIISNSSEENIKNVLSEADLLQYFDEILGGDMKASKAERMRKLLSKNGLNAEYCTLITDTLGDIKEGKGLE